MSSNHKRSADKLSSSLFTTHSSNITTTATAATTTTTITTATKTKEISRSLPAAHCLTSSVTSKPVVTSHGGVPESLSAVVIDAKSSQTIASPRLPPAHHVITDTSWQDKGSRSTTSESLTLTSSPGDTLIESSDSEVMSGVAGTSAAAAGAIIGSGVREGTEEGGEGGERRGLEGYDGKCTVQEINEHLLCALCSGYLIEATSVIECLHTFCRSCIVKYLESSETCPVCDTPLHPSNPLQGIRLDKTLQMLVYKLVPGVFKDEMRRRCNFVNELYQGGKNSEEVARLLGDICDMTTGGTIYTGEEKFSVCLQFSSTIPKPAPAAVEMSTAASSSAATAAPADITATAAATAAAAAAEIETESEELIRTPPVSQTAKEGCCYLLCPASLTIKHLKKLIRHKLQLEQTCPLNIYYSCEDLDDRYTLTDIAYVTAWTNVKPLHFSYTVSTVTSSSSTIPQPISERFSHQQTSQPIRIAVTSAQSQPLTSPGSARVVSDLPSPGSAGSVSCTKSSADKSKVSEKQITARPKLKSVTKPKIDLYKNTSKLSARDIYSSCSSDTSTSEDESPVAVRKNLKQNTKNKCVDKLRVDISRERSASSKRSTSSSSVDSLESFCSERNKTNYVSNKNIKDVKCSASTTASSKSEVTTASSKSEVSRKSGYQRSAVPVNKKCATKRDLLETISSDVAKVKEKSEHKSRSLVKPKREKRLFLSARLNKKELIAERLSQRIEAEASKLYSCTFRPRLKTNKKVDAELEKSGELDEERYSKIVEERTRRIFAKKRDKANMEEKSWSKDDLLSNQSGEEIYRFTEVDAPKTSSENLTHRQRNLYSTSVSMSVATSTTTPTSPRGEGHQPDSALSPSRPERGMRYLSDDEASNPSPRKIKKTETSRDSVAAGWQQGEEWDGASSRNVFKALSQLTSPSENVVSSSTSVQGGDDDASCAPRSDDDDSFSDNSDEVEPGSDDEKNNNRKGNDASNAKKTESSNKGITNNCSVSVNDEVVNLIEIDDDETLETSAVSSQASTSAALQAMPAVSSSVSSIQDCQSISTVLSSTDKGHSNNFIPVSDNTTNKGSDIIIESVKEKSITDAGLHGTTKLCSKGTNQVSQTSGGDQTGIIITTEDERQTSSPFCNSNLIIDLASSESNTSSNQESDTSNKRIEPNLKCDSQLSSAARPCLFKPYQLSAAVSLSSASSASNQVLNTVTSIPNDTSVVSADTKLHTVSSVIEQPLASQSSLSGDSAMSAQESAKLVSQSSKVNLLSSPAAVSCTFPTNNILTVNKVAASQNISHLSQTSINQYSSTTKDDSKNECSSVQKNVNAALHPAFGLLNSLVRLSNSATSKSRKLETTKTSGSPKLLSPLSKQTLSKAHNSESNLTRFNHPESIVVAGGDECITYITNTDTPTLQVKDDSLIMTKNRLNLQTNPKSSCNVIISDNEPEEITVGLEPLNAVDLSMQSFSEINNRTTTVNKEDNKRDRSETMSKSLAITEQFQSNTTNTCVMPENILNSPQIISPAQSLTSSEILVKHKIKKLTVDIDKCKFVSGSISGKSPKSSSSIEGETLSAKQTDASKTLKKCKQSSKVIPARDSLVLTRVVVNLQRSPSGEISISPRSSFKSSIPPLDVPGSLNLSASLDSSVSFLSDSGVSLNYLSSPTSACSYIDKDSSQISTQMYAESVCKRRKHKVSQDISIQKSDKSKKDVSSGDNRCDGTNPPATKRLKLMCNGITIYRTLENPEELSGITLPPRSPRRRHSTTETNSRRRKHSQPLSASVEVIQSDDTNNEILDVNLCGSDEVTAVRNEEEMCIDITEPELNTSDANVSVAIGSVIDTNANANAKTDASCDPIETCNQTSSSSSMLLSSSASMLAQTCTSNSTSVSNLVKSINTSTQSDSGSSSSEPIPPISTVAAKNSDTSKTLVSSIGESLPTSNSVQLTTGSTVQNSSSNTTSSQGQVNNIMSKLLSLYRNSAEIAGGTSNLAKGAANRPKNLQAAGAKVEGKLKGNVKSSSNNSTTVRRPIARSVGSPFNEQLRSKLINSKPVGTGTTQHLNPHIVPSLMSLNLAPASSSSIIPSPISSSLSSSLLSTLANSLALSSLSQSIPYYMLPPSAALSPLHSIPLYSSVFGVPGRAPDVTSPLTSALFSSALLQQQLQTAEDVQPENLSKKKSADTAEVAAERREPVSKVTEQLNDAPLELTTREVQKRQKDQETERGRQTTMVRSVPMRSSCQSSAGSSLFL